MQQDRTRPTYAIQLKLLDSLARLCKNPALTLKRTKGRNCLTGYCRRPIHGWLEGSRTVLPSPSKQSRGLWCIRHLNSLKTQGSRPLLEPSEECQTLFCHSASLLVFLSPRGILSSFSPWLSSNLSSNFWVAKRLISKLSTTTPPLPVHSFEQYRQVLSATIA